MSSNIYYTKREEAKGRSGTGESSSTRSESKQYQWIGRLEVRTGRVVRQADSASQQARVKTRRARKKTDWEKIGARRNAG